MDYAIQPEDRFQRLRSLVHATSRFAGMTLQRTGIALHLTIAEFITVERTEEPLAELQGNVSEGTFRCSSVEYAVPNATFYFERVLTIPIGSATSSGRESVAAGTPLCRDQYGEGRTSTQMWLTTYPAAPSSGCAFAFPRCAGPGCLLHGTLQIRPRAPSFPASLTARPRKGGRGEVCSTGTLGARGRGDMGSIAGADSPATCKPPA